jgi:hypothetical protein
MMKDADGIFTRFKTNTVSSTSNVGFMLGITPIEPLYIGVSVPSVVQIKHPGTGTSVLDSYNYWELNDNGQLSSAESSNKGNAAHTYEKIQVGAGFTIANIGLVRAQYVGASYIYKDMNSVEWTNNLNVRRIEAAFAYTGMAGLVVDVGAKIPLSFKNYEVNNYTTLPAVAGDIVRIEGDVTYQAPFQVSLGAGYTADALDVKGRVDVQFAGSAKDDNAEYNLGLNINAHLTPSYNLGFAPAGLDVGFEFLGENTNKDGDVVGKGPNVDGEKGGYRFGVGAWLRKAYGGASIKGGLGLRLGEVNGEKEALVFSVPIIFDYSF